LTIVYNKKNGLSYCGERDPRFEPTSSANSTTMPMDDVLKAPATSGHVFAARRQSRWIRAAECASLCEYQQRLRDHHSEIFTFNNGMPWFQMDIKVTNGSSITSRYLCPIKSSSQAGEHFRRNDGL